MIETIKGNKIWDIKLISLANMLSQYRNYINMPDTCSSSVLVIESCFDLFVLGDSSNL